MNTFKKYAVIFDCDGVMFDSRQANINYYNHMLARFGLPSMTDDEVSFVHMHTAEDSIRHIFRETTYLEDALNYRVQVDYSPFISDMIIEPGLKELLKRLKPDFGLAVATNRSNTIGQVIENNHLEDFFDIIVSSLDVKNPKPHPESIWKILKYFEIEPSEALYVGDSEIDYQTAMAAGVFFISYKNRELKTGNHAGSMNEVGRIIEEIISA